MFYTPEEVATHVSQRPDTPKSGDTVWAFAFKYDTEHMRMSARTEPVQGRLSCDKYQVAGPTSKPKYFIPMTKSG